MWVEGEIPFNEFSAFYENPTHKGLVELFVYTEAIQHRQYTLPLWEFRKQNGVCGIYLYLLFTIHVLFQFIEEQNKNIVFVRGPPPNKKILVKQRLLLLQSSPMR